MRTCLSLFTIGLLFLLLATACQAEEIPGFPQTTIPTSAAVATRSPDPTESPPPTATPKLAATSEPTRTPFPTNTQEPEPTATPEPTIVPTPTPEPSPLANLKGGLLLEETNPEAADQIKALPWVADGWNSREPASAEDLIELASTAPEAFGLLIIRPWILDGISSAESRMTRGLKDIEDAASDAAAVLIRAEILDGTMHELGNRISRTVHLIRQHPDLFEKMWQLPWLADGVTSNEWTLLKQLAVQPQILEEASLWQRPWTQDGIDQNESQIIVQLASFAKAAPDLTDDLLRAPLLDWIEPGDVEMLRKLTALGRYSSTRFLDTVNGQQYTSTGLNQILSVAEAVYALGGIYARKEGAELILAMPFLETIEPWDLVAIEAMRLLSNNGYLTTLMNHPEIQPGITDQQAKIIAALPGVTKHNPDLLDILLKPRQVILEERTIELPLAGTTHLVIIRTTPGDPRTMDLIEHAARTVESLMAAPFPTRYVAYLIADAVPPTPVELISVLT